MKLSAIQQRVIDMMRDGWRLKSSAGPDARYWLAKVIDEKACHVKVNSLTVRRLFHVGIISFDRKYPISTWKLK